MSVPVRVQLSRAKGFDLQALSLATNGLPAQRVSRPGPWGNPFTIAQTAARTGLDPAAAQAQAVADYAAWVEHRLDPARSPGPPPTRQAIRAALSGKNLACWCRPGTPCHADILIALANGPEG